MTDLASATATRELTSADTVHADPADSGGPDRGAAAPQVLVVDDDPGIRLVFARALARAGYEVFLAASGTEALVQIDRQPDIVTVLCDLDMPRMTGYALAQRIHQRQPGLPILYVSASQHAAELVNHPSIDLLTKPVTADQLIGAVDALVHRLHHQPSLHRHHPTPRRHPTAEPAGHRIDP